jgi:hypothetical protein
MRELAQDVATEEAEQPEQRAREGRNEFGVELDPKTKIQKHDEVELYIDTSRLHFFESASSTSAC